MPPFYTHAQDQIHQMIPESLHAFLTSRATQLTTVQTALLHGFQTGNFQSAYNLPHDTIMTAVGTLFLAQFIVLLLTRGGRSFLFKTVDTVLAIIFLVIILSIVLGLPFGMLHCFFCVLLIHDSLNANAPKSQWCVFYRTKQCCF